MSRLRNARLAYRSTLFAVMQVFGFIFSAFGFAMAVGATGDLLFDWGWGATWPVIPGAIGFGLVGLGFVWLVRQFRKAVDHYSPL